MRAIIWKKRDRDNHRFYLFAGMGGRALRRKRNVFLLWSVITGLLVSATLAVTLFFVNHYR